MSIATPAELKARAPEFAALSDPTVQIHLDMATEEIEPTAWGSRAKSAEILLACHKMIVLGTLNAAGSGGGGATGPIQSASVGDVSVTYGATASLAVQLQGLDPALALSRYGLEYARLIKLAAMGGAVLDGSA